MNLAFSQTWPDTMEGHLAGKPTLFPQKIWRSGIFDKHNPVISNRFIEKDGRVMWDMANYGGEPKLHTIRKDKANRWRAGMDIHFFINNRTKDMFQFAPVVKCVSIQRIWIHYTEAAKTDNRILPRVFIGGRIMSDSTIKDLAMNDGFDSVRDFFSWFKEDFTGVIIHWTNLKY